MSKQDNLPFDFEIVTVAKHLGNKTTKFVNSRRWFLRVCGTDSSPDFKCIAAVAIDGSKSTGWRAFRRTFVFVSDSASPDMVYMLVIDSGGSVHRIEAVTYEDFKTRVSARNVFPVPVTEIELGVDYDFGDQYRYR